MLLNTTIVKDLRETLQKHLLKSMNEFEVTVGNASFNDTEVNFKLNLRLKGAKTQFQKDLEFYGNMNNLDLTKIAKLDGKDFSLSGFRRKARSKPYLIQDLKSGGEYIITTDIAKKYFGKGESA
jgi:hypothetical protein